MVAPPVEPISGGLMLSLLIGGVIAIVAWLLLIVAAFREKVWWGLLVLGGPFVVDFLVGRNAWASTIGSLFVILPFALPRFTQKKIAICFAILAVGAFVSTPGADAIYKVADAQEKARITAAEKPVPPVAPPVAPTYTLPPVEASVTARPQLKVVNAPPDIVAPEIVQVYVVNATKTFYPLDCGKQPDGAYKMSKSMAVRQGYKLAKECGN